MNAAYEDYCNMPSKISEHILKFIEDVSGTTPGW